MREVQRHRTAIARRELSRPLRLALSQGLLRPGDTVFDYGCGRGDDLRLLAARGFRCSGWDPHFRPDAPLAASDVVNLGYVLNVVEDPAEREAALRSAWTLARRVLLVAARVERAPSWDVLGDGLVSSRGTFQKFFTQRELRGYVEAVLGITAWVGGQGVFWVCRQPRLCRSGAGRRIGRSVGARSSETRKSVCM